MKTGTYISGIGHAAFILWALFGSLFLRASDMPPVEATEVSLISAEDFAALTAPVVSPEAEVNVPLPMVPEIDDSVPVAPRPDSAPETLAAPQVAIAPEAPELAPNASEIQPLPEAEIVDVAPETPVQPRMDVIAALPRPTSSPRDLPRVAPMPAPQPEPDREVAPEVTEEAVPDAAAEVVVEDETATAPEAATTEIVTEATETATETATEVASAAPAASPKPKARPRRPTPEPVKTAASAEVPAPTETEDISDAVNDILAGQSAPAALPTRAPSGPPLTRGERDALKVAVEKCWNVGSLSTEALKTTVVVAVSLSRDGKPDAGSIRMLSSSGGGEAAAKQAFEAGRRAIRRCGAKGFDLPAEKYEQWRDIEMTFNPEKMRYK